MVHELKDQIKGAFFFPEVHSVLFIRDDFFEAYDVLMLKLPQDLDLTDGRDGKTFLLVLQPDFLNTSMSTKNGLFKLENQSSSIGKNSRIADKESDAVIQRTMSMKDF